MNKVHPIFGAAQRRDEAAAWIARLDRGLSAQEAHELSLWMAADARNRHELTAMAELWDQMEALSKLSDVIPREPRRSLDVVRYGLAASVVLLVIVFAAAWLTDQQGSDLPVVTSYNRAHYETAVGDQSVVHLSDGSIVQLNTDTRFDVSMHASQRILRLVHGEIHVDVAHDPTRPMIVEVENLEIKAIGTAFNVMVDEKRQVELIVTEGLVSVGVQSGSRTLDRTRSFTGQLVGENQRLIHAERAGEKSVPLRVMESSEVADRLSWRSGNLVFRGETLGKALEQIERYNEVTFLVESEALKTLRVAGLYKTGDLKGFLGSLRSNFGIENERVDDRTILLTQPAVPE